METLLTDEWLPEADAISILDEASLTLVRERVREIASANTVEKDVADRAALVATELGRNQLRHAIGGRIAVRVVLRRGPGEPGDRRGIEVVAADLGEGISDVQRAFDGTPRTAGTLGVGLAMVRENALEVDFDVREREGSCVWARMFGRGVVRRREVGVYGRAIADERASGDHARFWRSDELVVAAVCDGLGHGPPAREASNAAIAALRAQTGTSPVDLLEACDRALGPTRGAVMAIACLDEAASSIELSSVGNIAVQLSALRDTRRFGGSSAVLGRPRSSRPRAITASLEGGVLVMLTDGITSQFALEEEPELLREHPIVIAEQIVQRFGRANDDALVLVSR